MTDLITEATAATPDTDALIAEMRALRAKTTPGEWRAEAMMVSSTDGDTETDVFLACHARMRFRANAKYVAAAHNNLPALLDELEQARADVRTLLLHVKWIDVAHGHFSEHYFRCRFCSTEWFRADRERHEPTCPIPDIRSKYAQEDTDA